VARRLLRGRLRPVPFGDRLPEAADREQGVVDPEGEAKHGCDVQGEDGDGRPSGHEGHEAESEEHGQRPRQYRQRGRAHRAEGEEQKEEGDGQDPALGAPSVVGGGAPEVVVDRPLAGQAQGQAGVGGPERPLQGARPRAQRRHQAIDAFGRGVEPHQDDRPPAGAPEERVRLIEVGKRAAHAFRLGQRGGDRLQDGAARGLVGTRHAARHEDRGHRERRREAALQGLFHRRRLGAQDARLHEETLLDPDRPGQESGCRREPAQGKGPASAGGREERGHASRAMLPGAGRKTRRSTRFAPP
jgi:hypothetical protein